MSDEGHSEAFVDGLIRNNSDENNNNNALITAVVLIECAAT